MWWDGSLDPGSAPPSPVAAGPCPGPRSGLGRPVKGAKGCLWRCRRGRGHLARSDWNLTFRRTADAIGLPAIRSTSSATPSHPAAATGATTKELRRLERSSPTAAFLHHHTADDRDADITQGVRADTRLSRTDGQPRPRTVRRPCRGPQGGRTARAARAEAARCGAARSRPRYSGPRPPPRVSTAVES